MFHTDKYLENTGNWLNQRERRSGSADGFLVHNTNKTGKVGYFDSFIYS